MAQAISAPSFLIATQDGSVDGALSSRPPMPGRPAVRLDWATRVSIAENAARGLADLQKASIGSVAAPVAPSRILLHQPAAPLLRPPDILELLSAPQVKFRKSFAIKLMILSCFKRPKGASEPAESPYIVQKGQEPRTSISGLSVLQDLSVLSSPELRVGIQPSPASDVYSLGLLILQLLTGSEAMGLLDYAQKAVDRGRLEDILDPCAEGISVNQAVELANLALRSVPVLS